MDSASRLEPFPENPELVEKLLQARLHPELGNRYLRDALAASRLLVPALDHAAGEAEVRLRAAPEVGGPGTVIHAFTDVLAMKAFLPDPTAAAVFSGLELCRAAVQRGWQLDIKPAGPGALVLPLAALKELMEDHGAAAPARPAESSPPSRADLEVSRTQAASRASEAARAREVGELGPARSLLDEAVSRTREIGDLLRTAGLLTELGNLDLQLGQTELAASELEEAVGSWRGLGRPREALLALATLAVVELRRGNLEQAQKRAEEALGTGDSGDRRVSIDVLNRAGNSHLKQGNLELARRYLSAALDLSRELEDPRLTAVSLSNLGWLDFQEDQVEPCAAHFWECIEVSGRLDDEALGRAAANFGWLESRLGDISAAHERASQALALSRDPETCKLVGDLLIRLGLMEKIRGDTKASRRSLQNAVRVFEAFADGDGAARARVALEQLE